MHTRFSSMHFLRFPVFQSSPVLFRRQVIQGFMRSLTVVFRQPALCELPCFIQCPEQIKIRYLCPVRPVKAFDKGILRRFTRFNKLQNDPMFFNPLCQRQQDQFWSVIHPHLQRVAAVCHDPVQDSAPRYAGIFRSISIARASRLKSSTTLEVRNSLPHTSASCIKSTSSDSVPQVPPVEPGCASKDVVFPCFENSMCHYILTLVYNGCEKEAKLSGNQ
jgi:hypothetical protein